MPLNIEIEIRFDKKQLIWYKYHSKVSIERKIYYLSDLTDSNFQWVNRLFVLLFEDSAHRTRHTRYFLSEVEITDCNVMIDGQTFF